MPNVFSNQTPHPPPHTSPHRTPHPAPKPHPPSPPVPPQPRQAAPAWCRDGWQQDPPYQLRHPPRTTNPTTSRIVAPPQPLPHNPIQTPFPAPSESPAPHPPMRAQAGTAGLRARQNRPDALATTSRMIPRPPPYSPACMSAGRVDRPDLLRRERPPRDGAAAARQQGRHPRG